MVILIVLGGLHNTPRTMTFLAGGTSPPRLNFLSFARPEVMVERVDLLWAS
jgi:hypothetical protein